MNRNRGRINIVPKKLGAFICLVILLVSCQPEEYKHGYYKDYRGFIHKQFFCSSDKEKAIWLVDRYQNLGRKSITDFHNECARKEIACIKAKKVGEVIRYYSDLGIAKVLYRFSNEELNAPARIDVRKRKYYVPILLLHDTVPKVDTVKYMPDAYDW